MLGYNKIVIIMVIILFFLMVYVTKDYREGLFGSSNRFTFSAESGKYIKLKGITDGIDNTGRIVKIVSKNDERYFDVSIPIIENNEILNLNLDNKVTIANKPNTTYIAPNDPPNYDQFNNQIKTQNIEGLSKSEVEDNDTAVPKDTIVLINNIPETQLGSMTPVEEPGTEYESTIETLPVTVKQYSLAKVMPERIYLSGYNDDEKDDGITDIYQVKCYVEFDSATNSWSTSTLASNKYILFYIYRHQIIQKYYLTTSQSLQFAYILDRWKTNSAVVSSLTSAQEETVSKVANLFENLEETVQEAKRLSSDFNFDGAEEAVQSVSATTGNTYGDGMTVKINTSNSSNKFSNFTNTASLSPITDFTVRVGSNQKIRDLKEEIHDALLKQGITLPVDVQILSPDSQGTANVYNDEAFLSQGTGNGANSLLPSNESNEVYLGIQSDYSLAKLPCPNGCNKGQLNYIDQQCYDHIYTFTDGSESYQYKYCRPKCVQDECSTTGCAKAEDCKGCDIYRVKERTDVNRINNIGLFHSRDSWVKNTEEGTKMAGSLMYNFVNNVWSTICNKIDPPEEDPCKCCDSLSNKNIECGENLVNYPAIGANKLFDDVQDDLSNRNQISLENEPVNAFANVQTTSDINMNKVVPYEAVWDVDVLNNK